MALTVTQGTQTAVYTKLNAGTEIQVVKLDIGAGTAIADFGGTINRVTDLLKGTVTSVGTLPGVGTLTNVGSLTNVGTVKGIDTVAAVTTVNSIPAIGARHADAFATVVSTGTSTMGTIKAAVSGSAIYITDLVISAGSATNVEIASGGTSTPVIGTLHLAANGGAVMNFNTPASTASGSALVYKQSAAISPLSISCWGFVD